MTGAAILEALTVTELNMVFTATLQKNTQYQMQNREWCGISFAKSGQVLYELNGKKLLCKPGTVILHPMGSSYHYRCLESGDFPIVNFKCSQPPNFTELIGLTVSGGGALLELFKNLEGLYGKTQYSHSRAFSLLYEIISLLASAQNADQCRVLQPAMNYLERHYQNPELSNAELAHCTHLSESYFRRLFKESTGQSPHQYIMQVRIGAAKNLLLNSTLSVAAIAEQTGFINVYHFCKAFKKQTGCTPTDYRKCFWQL